MTSSGPRGAAARGNPWTWPPDRIDQPQPRREGPPAPAAPTGPVRPQPGVVQQTAIGLPFRRIVPPDNWAPPAWWWSGCHGGAGITTLRAAAGGGAEAGPYWPLVPAESGVSAVVLVARTHATGLQSAQAAVQQWASGRVPQVRLVGLVLVADAPGRLPKPLAALAELVSGGAPRCWRLPWVEALRLGEPPGVVDLPAPYGRLAADLVGVHLTERAS